MSSTIALQDLLAPVHEDLRQMNQQLKADLRPKTHELESLVSHVARYQGKQLRPALVFLAARLFGEPREAHFTCAKVVELIHLATLVHDDILDGASLRRRVPTVNQLHGNEVPVLLGDYIYALAFQMSLTLDDPTCSRLLSNVTRVICQGEITQSLHRLAADWTEDRYFQVIGDKTASLYAAACKLGGHYAGASADEAEALWDFGYQLGLAFQVVDDCLDLAGDESVVGKSLGTDLQMGKLTLPLLYLKHQGCDGGQQLVDLLANGRSAQPHAGAEAQANGGPAAQPNGGPHGRASGSNGNGRSEQPDGSLLQRLRQEFAVDEAVNWSLDQARSFVAQGHRALAQLPAGEAREAMAATADYVLRRKF